MTPSPTEAVQAVQSAKLVTAVELGLLRRSFPELREAFVGGVAVPLDALVRAARDRGLMVPVLEALSWLLHQRAGSSFAFDTDAL